MSEQLRSRLIFGRAIATVIPDGVDTRLFAPEPRHLARTRLGWNFRDPVILSNAGRSPGVKRLDLATQAFDLVRQQLPGCRLFVLDGNYNPDLVPTVMNASDCLLFASDFEGSPNVVKEAVACGLPVVTVPVGDVRRVLRGVKPSFIVEQNASALAKSLAEVLSLCERSNGPDVAGSFELASTIPQILRIFAEAAGRSCNDQAISGSRMRARCGHRIHSDNG